ncbi:MAG: pyridoxal-phosphate-dependent aminotransferase family protein [Geminicoccales bacterium]
MSVRNGREFLSIPGPTTVPDEVLRAMHRPAVDIYNGSDLEKTTDSLLSDLRKVFRTEGRTYIYATNGHGAWEAAASNVLSRGDKVLVLESGRFAIGWGEMASMMGVEVEVLNGKPRGSVDPSMVEARLRADIVGEIKAVLVVQVDTASSVVNDIPRIRQAIDAAGHPALFMVDTIASLGIMPYNMDEWGVDVTVAAGQKGLMTPPGLSFVAANKRAIEKHQTADLRTRYWDWTQREGPLHYQKYCGTPPEHLLFALRQALTMLSEEGLEHVFERHRLLSEAVRRAVLAWSEAGALSLNIIEPAERSNAVTTVLTDDQWNPDQLLTYCREKCGVVLGIGIGDFTDKAFRIAHMGHVNAPMMMGTLSTIEIGLGALGIPHGRGGAQAAIDWLSESVRP